MPMAASAAASSSGSGSGAGALDSTGAGAGAGGGTGAGAGAATGSGAANGTEPMNHTTKTPACQKPFAGALANNPVTVDQCVRLEQNKAPWRQDTKIPSKSGRLGIRESTTHREAA